MATVQPCPIAAPASLHAAPPGWPARPPEATAGKCQFRRGETCKLRGIMSGLHKPAAQIFREKLAPEQPLLLLAQAVLIQVKYR